jgi:hypothetical protein
MEQPSPVPPRIDSNDSIAPMIDATSTAISSPEDELIHKAVEKLYLESVDVGRDFSKSLITLCSSLFPAYVALSGFTASSGQVVSRQGSYLRFAPCLALLFALVLFIASYFPAALSVRLLSPGEVAQIREQIVKRRRRVLFAGVGSLLVAKLLLAALVLNVFH